MMNDWMQRQILNVRREPKLDPHLERQLRLWEKGGDE